MGLLQQSEKSLNSLGAKKKKKKRQSELYVEE